MDTFSGYEKMPNSLKKLNLSESEYGLLDKLSWVVTEKVHGANFSFIFENKHLKYAKRKEYLSWKDDFFGFQLVVEKLETSILRLFEDLCYTIPAKKYIVYGELFGGAYPHPDITPKNNVKAIQTGVYYSPSIEFYAFDIGIEPLKSDLKYYLDYKSAVDYFEKQELFFAKPLFTGKLNEALNFNTRINSTIPRELGLPELDENLIEGIVVKPYNHTKESQIKQRPIIKIKNSEFDEEDKFHEAKRWNYIPEVSLKSEELGFLIEELGSNVTKNRLNSAISKIGKLDLTNNQRIKDIENEFLNDLFTDFDENHDKLLLELNPEQKKWIEERILAEIRILIRLNCK